LADFAGNWVVKLGQRNFVVLKLKSENGHLTGSLSRPRHYGTSDGLSFSQVSADTVTASVVRSSVDDGNLRFVVQNPTDKKDEDDYEMTLAGKNQATLKPLGFPIEPWKLTRVLGLQELAVATDWNEDQIYKANNDSETANSEMQGIFEEDQKDRTSGDTMTKEEWSAAEKRDAKRKESTLKLLDAGRLHAAKDFFEAAFVFQHGDFPDDYLLAHTLALIGMAKGDARATWIAAATLDRYLQSIGRPQVYGTQFKSVTGNSPATQEPYNRTLISDSLRRQLGVQSVSNQEQRVKQYNTPQ
jgi:hypothetical protein